MKPILPLKSSLKNLKRSLFIFALLVTFSSVIHAKSPALLKVDSASWVLDTTVGGVQCYYKITKCGDMDVVYLKFVNTNSSSKQISWNESMTTKRTAPQGNPNGRQTLTIAAGTTMASNCATDSHTLYVLGYEVDDGNGAKIYSFHFVNCQVQ